MRTITVGTDCSGMEVPIQALKKLQVPIDHRFASDIDQAVKDTIVTNFAPKVLYDNLMLRDNKMTDAVQVYCAGFPCQPFSQAGVKRGFSDNRGNVFFGVVDYIIEKEPALFILENVKGLMTTKQGKYYKSVMKVLRSLKNYNIHTRLLNSLMMAIPQSRPRWYCIAFRKDVDRGGFTWPASLPRMNIDDLLDSRDEAVVHTIPDVTRNFTANACVRKSYNQIRFKGLDPQMVTHIIDCDSSEKFASFQRGICPCILKSRSNGHWISTRGRRMNVAEMLRMQGIDPTGFKQAISDHALGEQVGNGMALNVVERILVQALPNAGLCQAQDLQDRWLLGTAQEELIASRDKSTQRVICNRERPQSAAPKAKRARV